MSLIPPGVDASIFNEALQRLTAAVGRDSVFVDDLQLSSYRDAYSPLADGEMLPSAAVAPDSVEQVQAVLKIVNDLGIPIWT
ncbi:hypothetical protein, partial [Enterococcus faecium]|uniref:hypothetical protein n=1 Tax=Enterococcus faecium TaxID=1352 RepID=UPI003F43293A